MFLASLLEGDCKTMSKAAIKRAVNRVQSASHGSLVESSKDYIITLREEVAAWLQSIDLRVAQLREVEAAQATAYNAKLQALRDAKEAGR